MARSARIAGAPVRRSREAPDLTGKTVVVTGGNSGIGKMSVLALAQMGATVVLASRSLTKGEAAAREVAQLAGVPAERVVPMTLDLASFASVRAFAADVLDRQSRLDVLLNNAGLIIGRFQRTEDGFEETIGVNHLGHFLLTSLLLDRLTEDGGGRVVNVSSVVHRGASVGELMTDLQSENGYDQMGVYAKSKLANVLFTRELARRTAGTGVTANAVHPGVIRSRFGRGGDASRSMQFLTLVGAPFMLSPRQGARTSVYLCSSPQVADVSGEYFVRRKVRQPAPMARDDVAARWLWDESERLIATVPA